MPESHGMIILSILGIIIFGIGLTHRAERKQWNKGACPCGKGFWRAFDRDSSGATGYKCIACENIIWQSWIYR